MNALASQLIEEGRTTVPSLLWEHGYATAAVGKWHLGFSWTCKDGSNFAEFHGDRQAFQQNGFDVDYAKPLAGGPLDHGFDYFFGIAGSLDMPPYAFIEGDRVVGSPDRPREVYYNQQREGLQTPGWRDELVDVTFAEKAVGFLEDHRRNRSDQPFFLYLSTAAPHRPCDILPDFVRGASGGWRGQKADIWDGGHREPFRSGGSVDGSPMELEIIDDYTFVIRFDEPFGQFLAVLTIEGWRGYTELINPSHYLRQFHLGYRTMDELRPELDKEELDDEWWNLFNARRASNWDLTRRKSIGHPGLYAWVRVESAPGVIEYERNPFYFKVDTEGKQLPYIDRIVSYEVSDHEMVMMKIIAGELDYVSAEVRLRELPLLVQNEENGGYRTIVPFMHTVPSVIYPNHTFPDPAWQEVVHDVRFRQALSLAIDRSELIDSLYYKQAEVPDSGLLSPEFAAYDPEAAEALLDALGMTERDSDGYRLSPSGEPFEIYFEVFNRRPDIVPATELFVEYFQEIGLRTSMRQIAGALRNQRSGANELQISVEYHHLPLWRMGYQSHELLPDVWTNYGTTWATWYNTDGREGDEPPHWVKDAYRLHRTIRQAIPGTEEAAAAWDEAYAWYMENMPFIFVVDRVNQPYIASNRLRNMPYGGFNIGASFTAEQFFFHE